MNKEQPIVLVIDDQTAILESLEMILTYAGYQCITATHGTAGIELLKTHDVQAVLLDIRMEGMDGITCLERIKQINELLPVIMISGIATVQIAMTAIKGGAYDLIEKPLDKDRVLVALRNAINEHRLRQENTQIRESIERKYEIKGESPAIRQILELIERVAPTDARVMITGENGTGKELVARQIHRLSKRSRNRWVELNCAAIPSELLESELFGHEKGSFTGAVQKKIGTFEVADQGTLFFDEIGDMSLSAQAKMLRAIEEGVVFRIGGNQPIPVNVRLISATNQHLEQAIQEKRFREDLYFRLNVVPIHLPPLRDRKQDIPLLADHFIREFCQRESIPLKEIEPTALNRLQNHYWPGNIRELRNTIERTVILTPRMVIKSEDISLIPIRTTNQSSDPWSRMIRIDDFTRFKDEAEKGYLHHHLEQNNWQISQTAKAIRMQRSNLYLKLEKYFPDYFDKNASDALSGPSSPPVSEK